MSRKSPLVSAYMTRLPHELAKDQSVAEASEIMDREGIHHLPIMDGMKLLGVLSSRDVAVLSAALDDARATTVATVCSTPPYTVPPITPLADVAAEMKTRGVGSAVVVDARVVVGIFTLTDALAALVDAYG
jgi:acetoin utilization protein AcuB